ncbi:MAG: hypothetical protein JW719_12420, partial [Pirellulales bacterium]|nr:hypothetical protein [Pirellulales bacterium]
MICGVDFIGPANAAAYFIFAESFESAEVLYFPGKDSAGQAGNSTLAPIAHMEHGPPAASLRARFGLG